MRILMLRRSGLVAVAALLVSTVVSPARAEGVFAGACTLRIDVAYSDNLTLLPDARSLALDGHGTCIVNGTVAPIVIQGVAATTPLTGGYSCAGGMATGTGVVQIAVPGFPDPVVQLTIIDTAGVVTMTVLALVLAFDGVADLLREPLDTAACGSWRTTTWEGSLVFQDPSPPPIR